MDLLILFVGLASAGLCFWLIVSHLIQRVKAGIAGDDNSRFLDLIIGAFFSVAIGGLVVLVCSAGCVIHNQNSVIVPRSHAAYSAATAAYRSYKKVWCMAIYSKTNTAAASFAANHVPNATIYKPAKPAKTDSLDSLISYGLYSTSDIRLARATEKINKENKAAKVNRANEKILREYLQDCKQECKSNL